MNLKLISKPLAFLIWFLHLLIKPKQLTAEEVQKAKSELQISQSVTTIENALKILEKNKDYIQDSNYLAKILKFKDNIEDLLTI